MSKELIRVSEGEIDGARRKLELLQIKLQQAQLRRQNLEEWVSWTAQKLVGLGCLIVGGVKLMEPGLLPMFKLNDPITVLGVGFGLIVGDKVIEAIARMRGTKT